MIRVDLHTHSVDSPDGGLDEDDYWDLITKNNLDAVAITDHGSVQFAKYLSSKPKFKHSIIVGQEIMTKQGEIIGLFLRHRITDNLELEAAVKEIRKQRGVVMVPHPADQFRSGLSFESIKGIAAQIDVIEARNGRISKEHPDG